jgi:polyisoprenoid-binding protein YceI
MKNRATIALPLASLSFASLSLLSLASLGAASVAAGAPRAQGAPAAASAAVAPSTITLDPIHSMAVFRIQHLGAGFFWGRFNEVSGTVRWPLDDSAAPSFDVVAEVKKVDTGNAKLDGNLQGPNFFNEAEFPTIVFKSTGATRVGERRYTVTGNLTLRGVTKPIEVDCVVTGIGKGPTGQKVGFECTFALKRSDYGMKWGIDAPKGALGDEVKMIIALEGDVAKE